MMRNVVRQLPTAIGISFQCFRSQRPAKESGEAVPLDSGQAVVHADGRAKTHLDQAP